MPGCELTDFDRKMHGLANLGHLSMRLSLDQGALTEAGQCLFQSHMAAIDLTDRLVSDASHEELIAYATAHLLDEGGCTMIARRLWQENKADQATRVTARCVCARAASGTSSDEALDLLGDIAFGEIQNGTPLGEELALYLEKDLVVEADDFPYGYSGEEEIADAKYDLRKCLSVQLERACLFLAYEGTL